LALVFAVLCGGETVAMTLWRESAENGYANIIDNTHPSYPLIQSDVVAQGNYAFHLANPSFQDNWFAIDQTLPIQPDTKLFFFSRLRYATTSQVARVQISTDGGNTWPTSIFNQAGSNGPGEDSFSLKEIDLSSYANQNLRFRFYYDFTGGSAYTGVSSLEGWFIDDIQIGSEFQKTQWSVGNPTAHEQLYLEYINRARADALVEAHRLRNENDPQIQSAYSFFGIDGQNIENQFAWYVDHGAMQRFAQPLSFQSELLLAAQLHTQDMFQNQFQGHNSSNNPPSPFQPGYTFTQRLATVGYSGISFAENVFSQAQSVAYGHAAFDVDWGNLSTPSAPFYNPAFDGQGMQNPAGHRRNIHNGAFKEIGIGVVNGTNGSVGPQLVTQDFGNPGSIRYITGVVYEDLNNNNFYDIGEGRPGVRIDVYGSWYYAVSTASGAYSVPVPQDGTYAVVFSGGGYQTFTTTATILNGLNTKLDYLVSAMTVLPGDFNNDGVVDTADYVAWRKTDGTPAGFTTWRENFGRTAGTGSATFNRDNLASAPEPATGLLLVSAAAAIITLVRRPSFSPRHLAGSAGHSLMRASRFSNGGRDAYSLDEVGTTLGKSCLFAT